MAFAMNINEYSLKTEVANLNKLVIDQVFLVSLSVWLVKFL